MKTAEKTRLTVHLVFAILFFLCVMIFKWIDDKSIIDIILKVAGYTLRSFARIIFLWHIHQS